MQKKLWILGLICILILSLAAVSAAATITSTASLKLGSDKQRASNPEADDTSDRDEFVTGSVTITNSGTTTLTSLTLDTVTPTGSFSTTDLSVTATFTKTTLTAGESTTATIKARIPEKLDAITKTSSKIRKSEFKVADLIFKDSSGSTATTVLNMQRENQLEVDDVDICVNDKCKSVDDGDDIDNIKPGDRIEIRITAENKYSDNDREDIDFDDVEVEFEIDDSDFNEDDDDTINSLNADDKDEVSFSFDVDDDISDGSYNLDIRVFGVDDHSAQHGEEISIDLHVDRKTHDINIRRASISPTELLCGVSDPSVRVTASITNIGKRDEDDVALEVSNDELTIRERIENIQLDEDDSTTETFSFTVSDKAKPGVYRFKVKSFFDDTAQSDEEEVALTIPDCDEKSTGDDDDDGSTDSTTTTVTPTTQPTQPTGGFQPPIVRQRTTGGTSSKGSSFTDSSLYIVLLILVTLIVLAALIFLITRVLMRR